MTSLCAQQVIPQYQDLSHITLCHYNKRKFVPGEDVSISVKVKNIPKLQVKLFEVNTDAYFRKDLKPFASDINLDGLEAKDTRNMDYSTLPKHREHVEEFKYPALAKKRGLYVIEFIGNGLSTRAIV